MTKEEVLQKVNEYCDERSYTNETLTDEFKEKFADFFIKKFPEDTSIDSDGVVEDIHFNINTAFSAASKKAKTFAAKEQDYLKQIEGLRNQVNNKEEGGTQNQVTQPTISQELQDKLDKLEKFEQEARLNQKFTEVVNIAKRNVRPDLHKSLENYATDFIVNLTDTSEEQAKKLTTRFQEIFRDSIGDIKPLAPKQTQKREEEFIASIPKVKI